ncbi:uncharacterized protein F4817DRAFT_316029 [Daldinia loculata]|uniref:uncharacterized protein n=1 Tax=Daldinia loculata TaxID=103429 RepID=UPI0020C4B081|nr:uncharacterized protein F4817DRAFT_316029 [Daldinia loculata]KAI1647247.1 hypothetical protein F4817DRAFT_316029 [Daldinia loculata]
MSIWESEYGTSPTLEFDSNNLFSDPTGKTAQTLEQRRRNAKFAKDQDARRGKSETDVKKQTKGVRKSPISPFWLGILGFIVFGGLIFELISRIFFR